MAWPARNLNLLRDHIFTIAPGLGASWLGASFGKMDSARWNSDRFFKTGMVRVGLKTGQISADNGASNHTRQLNYKKNLTVRLIFSTCQATVELEKKHQNFGGRCAVGWPSFFVK